MKESLILDVKNKQEYTIMELKEDEENVSETSRQLFLVGAPRDPLVSAGAIVASSVTADEMSPGGDLQSSALVGLIGAQSSSVCFPAKFSKWTLSARSLA